MMVAQKGVLMRVINGDRNGSLSSKLNYEIVELVNELFSGAYS
jgi:hypothetical protein